jgi:hypothetical protein
MVTAMVAKDITYGASPSDGGSLNIGLFLCLSDGPCQNNFCGCDRLPHVTLSMIGDVHQQPGNRRGQLLPAHSPDLFQYAHIERPNPNHALRQG